ncbi:hypothetical protein [Streptomyces sp. NPDC097640]|uniref:hypothetical protein n=1 Tax=Streptomyces sp. NPDC097640 TaxID=3157229 RepID=UPI00332F5EFB
MGDVRGLDARALKITESIVSQVDAGQNHGFAEVRAKPPIAVCGRTGQDPAAVFAASAASYAAAYAEPDVLSRSLWLPEARRGQMFPVPMAIGLHLLGYVVRGWDVAA